MSTIQCLWARRSLLLFFFHSSSFFFLVRNIPVFMRIMLHYIGGMRAHQIVNDNDASHIYRVQNPFHTRYFIALGSSFFLLRSCFNARFENLSWIILWHMDFILLTDDDFAGYFQLAVLCLWKMPIISSIHPNHLSFHNKTSIFIVCCCVILFDIFVSISFLCRWHKIKQKQKPKSIIFPL